MRSFRCDSRQKGQRNDPEDVLIFATKEEEEEGVRRSVAEQEHPGRGQENWVRTILPEAKGQEMIRKRSQRSGTAEKWSKIETKIHDWLGPWGHQRRPQSVV